MDGHLHQNARKALDFVGNLPGLPTVPEWPYFFPAKFVSFYFPVKQNLSCRVVTNYNCSLSCAGLLVTQNLTLETVKVGT